MDKEKVVKLICSYNDYIDLLETELAELTGLANAHGWQSSRVEDGKKARDRIRKCKSKLLDS
jgi:hypothetical protein